MELKEAIEYALNGNAILFTGAGFSVGAKNIRDENLKVGAGLAEVLKKDACIDEDDVDLGYISELYLEKKSVGNLINLLKQEFNCKTYTKEQEVICDIPWKRVYTTNYDNVIEYASRQSGSLREAVTASDKIKNYINKKNIVVHLNGYIDNLNEDTLYNEFKLTEDSYLSRDKVNNWQYLLEDDFNNAKCIFFIGYSLEYDLSIKELIASTNKVKEKTFFVTLNPSSKTKRLMGKYGEIYDSGTSSFSTEIKNIKKDFIPQNIPRKVECFEKLDMEIYQKEKVADKDIIDLLFNGNVNFNHLTRSTSDYIVKREAIDYIVKELRSEVEVEIIKSDLGNGKSILLENLKVKLSEFGDVYTLKDINESFNKDLEIITEEGNKVFIFIENYNLYLKNNAFKKIKYFKNKNVKFIFSVRRYIHDNFAWKLYETLELDPDKVVVRGVDELTEGELAGFMSFIDNHNLWGTEVALSYKKKKLVLEKECNKEMKNILLYLFKSSSIAKKIDELLNIIKRRKELREILVISFVNSVIDLNLTLDNIILILGLPHLGQNIIGDKEINELIDFENNKINIKSSVVASYVLKNGDLNNDTVEILVKIVKNIDKHIYINKYNEVLRLLLAFSNLRIVLDHKSRNFKHDVIRYYENIQNLDFNKKNPFFWLQYAIARMDIDDYKTAKKYLDSAYALASAQERDNAYQLDSHKARLLLAETIYERKEEDAFANFMEAHKLIYNNSNIAKNLHYPLKQATYYEEFYNNFYKGFDANQKGLFLMACQQILDKIEDYNEAVGKDRHYEVIKSERAIKKILDKIRITTLV